MKHHLIKIKKNQLHKPAIAAVNRFEWILLIIRSDKTKICKQILIIDKDLGRIKQLFNNVRFGISCLK